MPITPLRPYFSGDDIEFITREFRNILGGNGFLTMGRFGEQFEEEFASYHSKKYAISCNSGTSALEIICRGIDVKGFEVIIPTNTFIATANAVIGAGGIPVFADIGLDMALDPKDVAKKITDETRAIMTVHIGGYISPSMYDLIEICDTDNLLLIEDAAQAHGSMLDNKKAGTFGVAGGFSFFPTKVMTTGEGGMVITDDEDLYRKALALRQFGKTGKSIYQNYSEILGYNWRMTEISALMGITQLRRLEQFIRRRTELANIYTEKLKNINGIKLMEISDRVHHNWFKYILFLKNQSRERFHKKLKNESGIDLSGYVYEIPLHKQPALKEYSKGSFPIAEDLCSRHICLPLFYSLTDDDVFYIVKSLRELIR